MKKLLIGSLISIVTGLAQAPPYNLQMSQQPLPIVEGFMLIMLGQVGL